MYDHRICKTILSVLAISALVERPASAQPLGISDILVVSNNQAREYSRTGALARTITIPNPAPPLPRDTVRGITMLNDGRFACFDGTFNPYVNIVQPLDGTNQAFNCLGWSTTNTGKGGGISSMGNSIYVTDMATFGSPEQPLNGLVRFTTAGTTTRFGPMTDFIDVYAGKDGLVYALPGGLSPGSNDLYVFNPETLSQTRHFNLTGVGEGGGIAIAIAANGDVYCGSSFISGGSILTRHSTIGAFLGSLVLPGGGVADLDIDSYGNIVVATGGGGIYVTNLALSSSSLLTTVDGGFMHGVVFVPEPSSCGLCSLTITIAALRCVRKIVCKRRPA